MHTVQVEIIVHENFSSISICDISFRLYFCSQSESRLCDILYVGFSSEFN